MAFSGVTSVKFTAAPGRIKKKKKTEQDKRETQGRKIKREKKGRGGEKE